jgi:hypothetical protein
MLLSRLALHHFKEIRDKMTFLFCTLAFLNGVLVLIKEIVKAIILSNILTNQWEKKKRLNISKLLS